MSHVEVRRAIEQRPCDVCGKPIRKGEQYQHQMGVVRPQNPRKPVAINVHVECPEVER